MLLSSLNYGAFLAYSPRGTDSKAKDSKNFMYAVKQDKNVHIQERDVSTSEFIAELIKDELNDLPFNDFFGPYVYLVPVPKSSPVKEGTLWVPRNIVNAFSNQGLGKPFICLERIEAVKKSAFSEPKDRPKASEHFRTIQIKSDLQRIENVEEIVLVDDLVTRGSTLLGSASRLSQVFPNASIRAFAVIRTISNLGEFRKIKDPCIGIIEL
ncbi:MAG: hypothetical protein HY518_05455, partial [Candidatus Aenigmarchaeota archaeon]|nr:hypothetical protein [Candidatus Aenigmarchaeota archaeon]